jgi:hypothetical protein
VAELNDPEIEVIRCLHAKVAELEERIAVMESGGQPVTRVATNGTVNGTTKPCRDEIERSLQTSLRALEGYDGKD